MGTDSLRGPTIEEDDVHAQKGTPAAPAQHGSTPEDDYLRTVVEAGDLIAEAKQVLIERHGLSAYEAFELLRHGSRVYDRPLRDVALKVVHGTWVAEA